MIMTMETGEDAGKKIVRWALSEFYQIMPLMAYLTCELGNHSDCYRTRRKLRSSDAHSKDGWSEREESRKRIRRKVIVVCARKAYVARDADASRRDRTAD
jgi:hypothetical protein